MKEIKIALLGGGFMGKAHSLAYATAPLAAKLGVKVTKEVLVDVDPERAIDAAQSFGWNSSTTDWREVVARDDIDVIDICTPPQFHAEIALAAIAAGKHVFVEKPITNDAAEAEKITRAAAANGSVVAQVGFNYRHTSAVEFTKQLLASGRLGIPLQFRGTYLTDGGLFSMGPKAWRRSKKTGGSGTVGDIGSHVIDSAEYLFGDIVRVAARARAGRPNEGWMAESDRIAQDALESAGVWVAEFANGAIGTFAVNGYSAGRKNRLYWELDASRGSVEFNWNNREEFRVAYVDEDAQHRGSMMILTDTAHPNGVWDLAGLGVGYVDVSSIQFQKFFRRILGEEIEVPTFASATHVQHVVEAVYRAAASDAWVDVPSVEVS
jgi:predicted dehydrogenase